MRRRRRCARGEERRWPLLEAVAAELGLKVEFIPVAWEGGITGVAAGRYDIYGGSLYDTLERQQAGTFVDFLTERTTLITTKAEAGSYPTRLDACGRRSRRSAARPTSAMPRS